MTIWHLFLAKIISCRHTSSTLCEDNDHEQGLSFTCFCTPPGPTPSGFYWGQKCSWILTSANSMQASSIQSDGRNMKQPDLKQGLNLPTSPNLCATNWSLAIWSSTYLGPLDGYFVILKLSFLCSVWWRQIWLRPEQWNTLKSLSNPARLSFNVLQLPLHLLNLFWAVWPDVGK